VKLEAARCSLPSCTASCSSSVVVLRDAGSCPKCCVSGLGTAPRWTSLLFLLFVKQKNRGAFRFAAHTNARENKSQEVALNAPVSAGNAGDLSDETRVICVTITKRCHYCRDVEILYCSRYLTL
jgi:hypothetical protein